MKRFLILIALLLTGFVPSSAFGRTWADADAGRPSRRGIRETARTVTVWNPEMITIREVSLDRTFESALAGVRIQYPSSWERSDLLQSNPPLTLIVMFLSPKESSLDLRQNINLVLEDLPAAMTLAEYTQLGIAMEKDFFDDYEVVESKDILLAGAYRAHRVIFTARTPEGDMTFEQLWTLRGNVAHVWTFADSASTFEQNVGTFERMMDTLTVQ